MSTQQLPPALQPWAPWLNWFQPELAAQLGPLLIRLHPLLGRFRGQRQGGSPEPVGVDDLRRRGAYQHLLPSEWLLATELPDEFLRRAAGGEHLFLSPRPKAQEADRLIVAVFDTGPWQLGAPRLVQLALWILLARRAVEADGELRWGVWQQPGLWHSASSANDLKQWLAQRRFEPVANDQWEQWSQWLAEQQAGAGECWLIGHGLHAARRAPKPPTHTVRLRPGLHGAGVELQLRHGAMLRETQLPLPQEARGASLLMGRFQPEALPAAHWQDAVQLSLRYDPVISTHGHRVAVPLLDHRGAAVYPVGSDNHGKRRKSSRVEWGQGQEPLAAGFHGKHLRVLVSRTAELGFLAQPEMGTMARPPGESFAMPPGRGVLPSLTWLHTQNRRRALVLDAEHRLQCWVEPTPEMKKTGAVVGGFELVDTRVLAVTSVAEGEAIYAAVHGGQLVIRFVKHLKPEARCYNFSIDTAATLKTKVLLPAGRQWLRGFVGFAAHLESAPKQEKWRMFPPDAKAQPDHDRWDVALEPGVRAIGLIAGATRTDELALVLMHSNRREFMLRFRDRLQLLYRSPAPAQRASMCANSRLLAILTQDKQLLVVTIPDGSLRLAVHTRHEPESDGRYAG